MTLTEIFEQLPKLTPDEKRQLRNVLDRELASESEQDESPEFLAELDRCVRETEAGARPIHLKKRGKWSRESSGVAASCKETTRRTEAPKASGVK